MSIPTITSVRKTTVRAFALGVVTGAFLTAGIVAATPAKADPTALAYSAVMGEAVCTTLAEFPSHSGITGIGQAIAKDGLTLNQAGEVMWMSVANICPQYTSLLMSYSARYGTDLA
jgi:hypothetical protein